MVSAVPRTTAQGGNTIRKLTCFRPERWRALVLTVIGFTLLTPYRVLSAQAAPAAAAHALTALDKLAIMELAARFETSLDNEDVQGYLATFTPDGVLEGVGPTARGPEALKSAFQNMLNTFARNRRHCSMNQIITGDDRQATMHSYLVVFDRNDLGRGGSAAVTDVAVKRAGKWYLASRKIDIDPSSQSSPKKEATKP